MGFLSQHLKGQSVTRNVDNIQMNIASAGAVQHNLGHVAQFVHLESGYTDAIMQTGLVGYNTPNPVFMNKTPHSVIIQATPTVKQMNSINRGGCN